MIQENLKLVDAVVEVMTRGSLFQQKPIIDDIVRDKTRIVALNKTDLADGAQTESWKEN